MPHLAGACPVYSPGLWPLCPTTDPWPFPQAIQTQLMIFLPKPLPPPNPSISNKQKASPPVTQALQLEMLFSVSLTFQVPIRPCGLSPSYFLSRDPASRPTPVVFHWDSGSWLLTCPLASGYEIPQISSLQSTSGAVTENCQSDINLTFAQGLQLYAISIDNTWTDRLGLQVLKCRT